MVILFTKKYCNNKQKIKEDIENQKTSFVATMVHDLRNPVIAQIRILEVLLNNEFGELNSKQREIFKTLIESSKHMNCILDSALETYRYKNGVIKLDYKEISFPLLVTECIAEVKYLALKNNLKIILVSKDNITNIECDCAQIKRVIMNLLSNQIKFAYKNSTIFVRIYTKGKFLYIDFENNSPYIPKSMINNIFKKYVSYAQTYKKNGIGLGLYAAKRIIEAHNGKIFAHSYKNNRNIFGFCIPLKTPKTEKPKTLCF